MGRVEIFVDKTEVKENVCDTANSVYNDPLRTNMHEEKADNQGDKDPLMSSIMPSTDNTIVYTWDVSEDPNVVLKQSQIEEFIMSCLKTEEGMPEQIYKETVKYFGHCISARFKKTILNKTHFCKIDQSIKYGGAIQS